MSHRINSEREAELQPKRIESTKSRLQSMGFKISGTPNDPSGTGYVAVKGPLKFIFYPYSGWWSGKGIGSGRGFKKLLKRIGELHD